jgi:hypothetical protein
MFAIPNDIQALRALAAEQTAELRVVNERLRPLTSQIPAEDIERLRAEASQQIPMPAPPLEPARRRTLGERLRALAPLAFFGASEAAK